MKILIIVFALTAIVTLHPNPALSQSASWNWAFHGINSRDASFNRVVSNSDGQVLLGASFSGNLTIGSTAHRSRGRADIIVGRFTSTGTPEWTLQLGDSGVTECRALAIDNTGANYIGGTFENILQIGSLSLVSKGAKDIFFAKYDNAGNLLWAKALGTQYNDELSSIGLDSKHNIVLGGTLVSDGAADPLSDTVHFGSISIVNKGDADLFIAKCDSSGNFLWVKSPGGARSESCVDLSVAANDNIILHGVGGSNVWLDGVRITAIDQGLFAGGRFIAALDSTGVAIWGKPIGGIGPSSGSTWEAMFDSYSTITPSGDIYVSGNFSGGKLIFDAIDYSTQLVGGGQWLAKYASGNGAVLWTKLISKDGYTRGVSVDPRNNFYLTGYCKQGAIYGQDTVNTKQSKNLLNLLALSIDANGQQRWLIAAGDDAGAVGQGISGASSTGPIIVGNFGGGQTIQLGNTACYNSALNNGFLAKIQENTVMVSHGSISSTHIFPNPARKTLEIRFDQGNIRTYSIVNSFGREVLKGYATGAYNSVDISSLIQGAYIIQLIDNGWHIHRHSFIKI